MSILTVCPPKRREKNWICGARGDYSAFLDSVPGNEAVEQGLNLVLDLHPQSLNLLYFSMIINLDGSYPGLQGPPNGNPAAQ